MTSLAGLTSLSGKVPPRSNHSTTLRVSVPSKTPLKTTPMAERIRSRATCSAPRSSPSYSSSNLPVIEGSAA